MELVVDLSTGAVDLHDGGAMGRFSLRAVRREAGDGGGNGALGALAAALSVHDAGTVEPNGDVAVPAAAVRRLAAEAAEAQGHSLDGEWESGFAAMLEHASTAGWITGDGSIRVHVEWGD